MSSRVARSKLRTTQGSLRGAQKGENILDVRGDLSWGGKMVEVDRQILIGDSAE